MFVNMNSDTSDRMLLSFKVKGESMTDSGALPIVSVYVGDTALDAATDCANAHNEGICLLKLDFNTGNVMYYTNRLKDFLTIEGFTLSADTWYSVDVVYNVVDSGYSVSVTDASDDSVKAFKDDIRVPVGYSTIENVRIGMSVDDILNGAAGSMMSLDDVFAYSGSFYRNPLEKDSQTEAAFADFIKIIENPSVDSDVKIAILSVYEKIVGEYNDTTENPKAQADMAKLRDYGAMLYVNYVAAYTDYIDVEGDYATRKANHDSVKSFYDAIPTDYSFLGTKDKARLESVKAAYDAEHERLAAIEHDCIAVLEVFNAINFDDFKNEVNEDGTPVDALDKYEDYSLIKAPYESTCEFTLVDFTYPGMAQYLDSYKKIYNNYEKIVSTGDAFIENIANYQAAETFADRYGYYRAAADIRASYLNTTYPGVLDAIEVLDYFIENTDILKVEEDAEFFIISVNRANFALYLSEKSKHWNLATPCLTTIYSVGGESLIGIPNCIEGVAEAKELYFEVDEFILKTSKAATDYIMSVLALEGLSGLELENAVNYAADLKVAGDIDGFELEIDGVIYKMTDINTIFSSVSTELSLLKGYCAQFITYVNMIDRAEDFTERYTFIRRALSIKDKVDNGYEGIHEAKAKLDVYVAEYRNDVAAANNSVSGGSAAESSSAVRSMAKSGAPRMVAFIGKYGKED